MNTPAKKQASRLIVLLILSCITLSTAVQAQSWWWGKESSGEKTPVYNRIDEAEKRSFLNRLTNRNQKDRLTLTSPADMDRVVVEDRLALLQRIANDNSRTKARLIKEAQQRRWQAERREAMQKARQERKKRNTASPPQTRSTPAYIIRKQERNSGSKPPPVFNRVD